MVTFALRIKWGAVPKITDKEFEEKGVGNLFIDSSNSWFDREGSSPYRVHCIFIQADENPADICNTVFHLHTKVTKLQVFSKYESAWEKWKGPYKKRVVLMISNSKQFSFIKIYWGLKKQIFMCERPGNWRYWAVRRKVETVREHSVFILPAREEK